MLLLKNWMESRFLFVKDLTEHDDSCISEHNVLQKIKYKTDWVNDFSLQKNVVSRYILKILILLYVNLPKIYFTKT